MDIIITNEGEVRRSDFLLYLIFIIVVVVIIIISAFPLEFKKT